MTHASPTRWLRLRHPDGFSNEMFERFAAGCSLWRTFVEAVIASRFHEHGPASYVCFEPQLSGDRRVASLPVGGAWTVGSRAEFENMSAYLLSKFIPPEFAMGLEEGLTETGPSDSTAITTSWRRPAEAMDRLLRQHAIAF